MSAKVEIQTELQKEIQVARSLAVFLDVLDSTGYEMMGFFSQVFLGDIADEGVVSDSIIDSYIRDFESGITSVNWINKDAKAKARLFVRATKAYRGDRSEKNAKTIIKLANA